MTDELQTWKCRAVGALAASALVVVLAGCQRHEVSSTPKPAAAEVEKLTITPTPASAEPTPAPEPQVTPVPAMEATSASEASNPQ